MKGAVLIVDDEPNMRAILRARLQKAGFEVEEAEGAHQALALLDVVPVDAVITDVRMPGMDGLRFLEEVVRTWPSLPVIILTAYGSVPDAVRALKAGAFDYIEKPFDKDRLLETVSKAVVTHRTRKLSDLDPQDRGRFGLIGRSEEMARLFATIERVAPTDSTVLIMGESGTGKELVARAIHEASSRSAGPFVRINCVAIPENLMESELFGYERGAFTGAEAEKPGKFEIADGGTILLDEIGELPTKLQPKLLRVLQEREVERVGALVPRKVDVRVIAATNVDLRQAVDEGRFREDLYYRLNVVPIVIPPLRERRDDIPLLVEAFVERFSARMGRPRPLVSPRAMEMLLSYPWPGNVRELENVIERTVLFCEGDEIGPDDLPDEIRAGSAPGSGALGSLKEEISRRMAQLERSMIREALRRTGGNVTQAAKMLGLSRRGLQIKMKELGIRKPTGPVGT